jgi:hypothetical protein
MYANAETTPNDEARRAGAVRLRVVTMIDVMTPAYPRP